MGSFKSTMVVLGLAGLTTAASAQSFSENFDSYADGSSIVGQGPWEVWYTGGVDAQVSGEHASSGANSLRLDAFSDIVQQFTGVSSGSWRFGAKVYMPSDSTGAPRDLFIILLNGYGGGGGVDNWSVQLRFGADDGVIESQFGGQTTPLTLDQWIDVKIEFNLDTDDLDILIDDVMLAENLVWSTNVSGGGALNLAACDLFSNGIVGGFIDDVYLEETSSCPSADFNGDQFVDFFDYGDYVACFEGDCLPGTQADFNGDGFVDFFDYGDFVFAFEGC